MPLAPDVHLNAHAQALAAHQEAHQRAAETMAGLSNFAGVGASHEAATASRNALASSIEADAPAHIKSAAGAALKVAETAAAAMRAQRAKLAAEHHVTAQRLHEDITRKITPETPISHSIQAPVGVNYEAVPGARYDPKAKAAMEALPAHHRDDITTRLQGEFIPQTLKALGVRGDVMPQAGGWEGQTNPSLRVVRLGDTSRAKDVAAAVGHVFRQKDGIRVFSGRAARRGSTEHTVASIGLKPGTTHADVSTLYDRLWQMKHPQTGEPLVWGHSTSLPNGDREGAMNIVHDHEGTGISRQQFGRMIDEHLGGAYNVDTAPAHVSFLGAGKDYGVGGQGSSESEGLGKAPVQEALDRLQGHAAERLQDYIAQAHAHQGAGPLNPLAHVRAERASERSRHAGSDDGPRSGRQSAARSWRGRTVPGRRLRPAPGVPGAQRAAGRPPPRHWSGERLAGRAAQVRGFRQGQPASTLRPLLAPTQRDCARLVRGREYDRQRHFARSTASPERAGHAMLAVLGPQNFWDNNVTLAERIADTVANGQHQALVAGDGEGGDRQTAAGDQERQEPGAVREEISKAISGKTLAQVAEDDPDNLKQAMWVRLFDEAHNPRSYRNVSPTGEFGGIAKGPSNWFSYNPIQKAISIFKDPSLENIDKQLGEQHKVRSFYSNITNPWDKNSTTMDTHAVAGIQGRPLGATAMEVAHNFGNTLDKKQQGPDWVPAKNDNETGVRGTYGNQCRGLCSRRPMSGASCRARFSRRPGKRRGRSSLTRSRTRPTSRRWTPSGAIMAKARSATTRPGIGSSTWPAASRFPTGTMWRQSPLDPELNGPTLGR